MVTSSPLVVIVVVVAAAVVVVVVMVVVVLEVVGQPSSSVRSTQSGYASHLYCSGMQSPPVH